MTAQLFNKAVALTDIHFGRSGNSPVANQDNLDFIDWFIDRALTWGAETCFMTGDWHDNRHSLHVSTMDYSLRGMEKLNKAFKNVWWMPGNHDLLYREKRDVTSVAFAKYLPNIHIVHEPMTIDGVTLLPWLVGDEPRGLKKIKSRYMFGHLELPGFMMNAKVPMPHHDNGATADDFVHPEYVFSGHFHFRQADRNVVYMGNPFPFNFADAWDEDRGMMFLEWGKEPYFEAWPEQPLFRTMKLSDLLDSPKKYLKPKMIARVTLDIEISFEESQLIRDTMVTEHGLRKLEMIQPAKQHEAQEFQTDVVFQSVDQIVIEGLQSVQSTGISSDLMIDIYRNLPNL